MIGHSECLLIGVFARNLTKVGGGSFFCHMFPFTYDEEDGVDKVGAAPIFRRVVTFTYDDDDGVASMTVER